MNGIFGENFPYNLNFHEVEVIKEVDVKAYHEICCCSESNDSILLALEYFMIRRLSRKQTFPDEHLIKRDWIRCLNNNRTQLTDNIQRFISRMHGSLMRQVDVFQCQLITQPELCFITLMFDQMILPINPIGILFACGRNRAKRTFNFLPTPWIVLKQD